MDEDIKVPLSDFVKGIAREAGFAAAKEVLEEHRKNCPAAVAAKDTAESIRRLEVKFATLIGLMVGSGTLGGACGAALLKAFGG